jgi:hypothetical protein
MELRELGAVPHVAQHTLLDGTTRKLVPGWRVSRAQRWRSSAGDRDTTLLFSKRPIERSSSG